MACRDRRGVFDVLDWPGIQPAQTAGHAQSRLWTGWHPSGTHAGDGGEPHWPDGLLAWHDVAGGGRTGGRVGDVIDRDGDAACRRSRRVGIRPRQAGCGRAAVSGSRGCAAFGINSGTVWPHGPIGSGPGLGAQHGGGEIHSRAGAGPADWPAPGAALAHAGGPAKVSGTIHLECAADDARAGAHHRACWPVAGLGRVSCRHADL